MTTRKSATQTIPLHTPSADTGPTITVFVQGFRAEALIGIWDHEKTTRQPLVFSLRLTTRGATGVTHSGLIDDHGEVVCYQSVVERISAILARGHVGLVETLGQTIITELETDTRILAIWLRIEKPDAIDTAAAVGVELDWQRSTGGHC